ncbi:MAG: beta propeller repeat protein [Candidatus Limnocylindria bacterium]
MLIVVAIAAGAGASRLARGVPGPSPSIVRPSPPPAASVEPSPTDTAPLVFTQPLSAGCVAGDGVYVVSDGGGIGRFADGHWQLIDPIARSLVAATCPGGRVIAVGAGGRVVTIDDRERTIRSDTVQLDDLQGVAPLGDGVLAVGRAGTVERQDGGGWGSYARGIDEDLYAVAAFDATSAWAVGAGGVTYRLEPAGWRPVSSGVTATLRAIAARSVDDAVAVGDDGVILVWSGAWTRLEPPVAVAFRAALRLGADTYVAGDRGTLLRVSGGRPAPAVDRIDLATTCTLRGLFSQGTAVWVVGSDGGHAAVWRIAQGAVFHWGECP